MMMANTAKKSMLFLASIAMVLLQHGYSSSAFIISSGPQTRLGSRSVTRSGRRCHVPQRQQQPAPVLRMSAGSAEEEDMNGLDKALVAWGVKSPPGEPELDIKEKIKSAGLAGALAYGGTELAFWVISVPLAVFGYHQTTGEWLDLTSLEGKEKLFGLTAGFLTFARLVVPLRIALALALTPAMDKYVVKGFLKKAEEGSGESTQATTEGEAWWHRTDDTAVEGDFSLQERLRKAELQERVRALKDSMES